MTRQKQWPFSLSPRMFHTHESKHRGYRKITNRLLYNYLLEGTMTNLINQICKHGRTASHQNKSSGIT